MRAMILRRVGPVGPNSLPLELASVPDPAPAAGEIVIRVTACGVCHTELDEIEGRAPPSELPRILGHQVVGTVVERGEGARAFAPGDRVGVGWIAWSCGECAHCRRGDENLCPGFRAVGRDVDGGYAELMRIDERFAHAIPVAFSDTAAAPLLCAGAIGYRSLRLTGLDDRRLNGGTGPLRLGLTGFGASAHLVLAIALRRYPGIEVFVFARREEERAFARERGAAWAGGTVERPPAPLDAIIDTTPAWKPVVEALRWLEPGGRLVINAIRKEEGDKQELLRLDYPAQLWLEKEIKSVANVTRRDIREFLDLAATMSREAQAGGAGALAPQVEELPLEEANRALSDLRAGRIRGAKVLRVT